MKIFRLLILLSLDSILSCVALYFSYSLVYQEFIYFKNINTLDYLISASLLISIFFISKIYFYRSRFLPKDIFSLYFKFIFIYFLIFFVLNHFFLFEINKFFDSKMYFGKIIPRSVLIIDFLLLFFLIIISRKLINFLLVFKDIYSKYFNHKKNEIETNKEFNKFNVCIYGAGSLGNLTLDFLNQFKKDVNVLCFFDDNKNLHGQIIKGIKINSLSQINDYRDLKSSILYVSIKDLNIEKINEIDKNYSKHFQRVVYLSDEFGNLKINSLHSETFNVDINKIIPTSDYSDKLHNDKSFFNDKNILITGCAGSIGKELVMQIINYNPKNLYLIDKNEHQLFELENYIELLNLNKKININFHLLNLENEKLLQSLNIKGLDIVFHAAAYKHVDMAEKNSLSVIYNNILSTYNICKFSIENNVKSFVNVSTDKAVNPTSVMGLSKRICELIVSKYAEDKNYYSVRFGNVINSSGSVLPLFKRQIINNQKITIRDLEATRYFMSIPEAITLILLSLSLNKNKNIFIFDMGEPVKIFDVAKRLCKIYNKNLVERKKNVNDIEYVVTGLKKGEKLHEELFIDKQRLAETEIKKIFKIKDNLKNFDLDNFINTLNILVSQKSEKKVKELLFSII
tara:strand:+ start:21008 stop:22888 length:1881 start_codon:yes stop_codon:yes gene_type:complete